MSILQRVQVSHMNQQKAAWFERSVLHTSLHYWQ